MGNEVTKGASTALTSVEELKSRVQKTRAEMPSPAGAEPFLKMQKDGRWTYGAAAVAVEDGSLWAINPLSFRQGWVCWTDYPKRAKRKNQNLGSVMVALGQDRPAKETLPEHIDEEWNNGRAWEWQASARVEMTCLTGVDKGMVVVYDTNSHGGLTQIDAYLKGLDEALSDGKAVAVVELLSESYNHPTYGQTWKPVFEFVEWRELDDTSEVEEQERQPDPEPRSSRQRSRPADSEEREAPRESSRRRRPASDDAPADQGEEEQLDSDEDREEDHGEPPAPTRRRRVRRPVS